MTGLIKQLGLNIDDITKQVSKEIKDGDFTAITDKKIQSKYKKNKRL